MTVPFPRRNPKPPPPEGLGEVGLAVWSASTSECVYDDSASLSDLASYCLVHDDLARMRARVAAEGDMVPDRFGQMKAHPLLLSIRTLEALKLKLARALHLGPEPEKKSIGRPAFSPNRKS